MFVITPEQQARIDEWLARFRGEYTGAVGGAITYCFTPTSIGVIVEVEHWSGERLDVTDYDAW